MPAISVYLSEETAARQRDLAVRHGQSIEELAERAKALAAEPIPAVPMLLADPKALEDALDQAEADIEADRSIRHEDAFAWQTDVVRTAGIGHRRTVRSLVAAVPFRHRPRYPYCAT